MRLPQRGRLGRLVPWALRVVTAVNLALLVVVALAYALPLPERGDGWSTVVEYRDGRPAHVFLSPDEKWRLPVALDRLDPKLIDALISLEDKRFWSHDGVDVRAIMRAAWTDVTRGRRVSGGSTLSMQLARLLEPRERTIPNKLIDMFRALQLDLQLPKREILAEYLARTPYGGNVEGIESAAWSYFGHAAAHLTPLEIATLLAVPQGPARYAPSPANQARLRTRRDAILRKLIASGVISKADAGPALADAAVTPPPDRLRPMPRDAPHVAVALRKRHPKVLAIRSTLEAGVQALVEQQVRLHKTELQRKGIHNGAVVVVDHHTRDVVAIAGNLDFTDIKHGGQIAMFERARSPGSTLKPFLYALAIDRGLALPHYLVADVPSQYGTYRPRNFDGDWQGLVTLEHALSHSLNMPFVDLLNQLGVETMLGELGRLGVALAHADPGKYGLSLILGGIEVSPLELAGLYATLAGDGGYRPLRLVATDRAPPPQAIFGVGAAWLTRQTLAIKDRPDFPRRRAFNGMPAEIHWKTGTSFGYRDAWAAGSGPRYTAVVWTGNVDNKPSTDLIGSEAAGPLLFDVLEGVAERARNPAPATAPADLATVEVCAYSGHVPGPACDQRVTALASRQAVPTVPCPYHQAFEVDRVSGHAVLPACRTEGRVYDRKSFLILPSSVNAWLVERNRAVPEAPILDPSCNTDAGGAAPVMVSPSEGQIVTLIPGVPAKNQLVPLTASTRATTLSWFVDGTLIGTAPSKHRQHWLPTIGSHDIVVADDAGRKARRTIVVVLAQQRSAPP